MSGGAGKEAGQTGLPAGKERSGLPDRGWLSQIRSSRPLIHCMTNYVTAGAVADMILAAGASPVMADGREDAMQAAALSQAMVINLGTLREPLIPVMTAAGRRAGELGHPVVLDPVGAGAFPFRRRAAEAVLKEVPVSLIRGNASEIRALAGAPGGGQGVDVQEGDRLTLQNQEEHLRWIAKLAQASGAIVVMSGETDLVSDGKNVCLVKNGHPMMGRITGAGCMMDGVLAAFLACAEPEQYYKAAMYGTAAMGICGELAWERGQEWAGGSFRVHLLDAMSCLTDREVEKRARIRLQS